MTSAEQSFRRSAAEVFATRVLVVFILFVTNVVVTRTLSTGDRGVYALAITLPIVLQMFAGLGVSQANVYFVNQEGVRVRDVLVNSVYLAFAIGAVLMALAVPLHGVLLDTVLKGMSATYLLVLVAIMPFSFMDLYLNGIIQGLHKFRIFNTRRLLVTGLMLTLVSASLLVMHWGLSGVIGSLATTIVITGLLFLAIVVRIDGFTWRANLPLGRRMLAYGGKSYAASLAGYLSYRLDVFLIAFLLDPSQVAFYAIAVSLVELVWYVPDSIGVVLFPRLSASRVDEETHRLTAVVCRITLFVTLVLIAVIAVVGRYVIVLLFGDRYAPSVAPMLLLLPGVTAIAVFKILWRNFSGRNRQQITVLAAGVALSLNMGLNLALIPRWGISGAAAVSSASYTLGTLILLAAFRRESGVSLRDTLIVRRGDVSGQLAWLRRGASRIAGGTSVR